MEINKVEVIQLRNKKGLQMEVCNFGASLTALYVLDAYKNPVNVVVGLQEPEMYTKKDYLEQQLFLGSSIGRYAGRIAKGRFHLKGLEYNLSCTNQLHLHGGKNGFDKKFWKINKVKNGHNPSVSLSYYSRHMEEGYPGNMNIKVLYELLETNALRIVYTATSDQTTIVNLTNHAYFNLEGEGTVANHELQLQSRKRLQLNSEKVPTGALLENTLTKYDFLNASKVIKNGFSGFNDVFVLDKYPWAVKLFSKKTGIYMRVITKNPSVVVFTPQVFPNLDFKNRAKYHVFPAICFETQNFPDAPNHGHFPSPVLEPGEMYSNETIYDFSTNPIQ